MKDSQGQSRGGGISRRGLLTGTGAAAAATLPPPLPPGAAPGRDRLAAALRPAPVPAAFTECDAQQCGFCTPGFVVAMRAALDKNPNATPAEIEEGLAGNICRCGTYEQMRHAIALLTKKGG